MSPKTLACLGVGIAIAAFAANPPAKIDPKQIVVGSSAGDTPGEEQAPPSGYVIPPAPALSPEEALQTFKLPPGYRIEIVASEPLVNTPVAIDFDPDGRIWVVEMRGYQNEPEGTSRLAPNGRIVVLEDTNGDGRMDKSTVYMDGLVLPRAIRVLSDGVLVGEPPYVWHTRDVSSDLKMDEKSVVTDDYGVRDSNPGHAPNGLLRGMDNWIHNATSAIRLKRVNGQWLKEPVPVLGHFGIGMDDFGRTYFNTNGAPLRANFIDTHYQLRNPDYEGNNGIFAPITGDSERNVFPIRVNPGTNRGYVQGTLRPDGRLLKYTAGCGISIFRGDRLPAEMKGNHFFCEPAGNLVRRTVLTENDDGTINGVNAHPGAEFLASTDERFRPVNTCTAPDGTLYIVDMYRGVLESHPFVTTYLKRQIYERGLLYPQDRGRIYRIVHESVTPGPAPRLSKASSAELVATLQHPNGWWRDTAQRLLVERKDAAAVDALRRLVRSDSNEIPRLHALWTLEGIEALTREDVIAAFGDTSKRIRNAAVRLSEPWLRRGDDAEIQARVTQAVDDPAAVVRLQAAASLGEWKGAQAEAAFVRLLTRHAAQPFVADASISGLHGRELNVLQRLGTASEWRTEKAEYVRVVNSLAASVLHSGQPRRIEPLLAWTASPEVPAWQRLAVLRSVTKPIVIARKITVPEALSKSTDAAVANAARAFASRLEVENDDADRPLTKTEQDMVRIGPKLYGVYCAQCHQANGQGLPELAPSLVNSKWVSGSPVVLAKLVLYGKQDKTMVMPPWGNVLDNNHVAAILTYIRRTWGNHGSVVVPDTIKRARAESGPLQGMWTEETLQQEARRSDKS